MKTNLLSPYNFKRLVLLVLLLTFNILISKGQNITSGEYIIKSVHSGKVLDVDNSWGHGTWNGQALNQWDLHGADHQKFIIDDLWNGYVRIRPKHSNKAIEVGGATLNTSAPLNQWDYWGGYNQQFRIEHLGSGIYRIVVRHSNQLVSVAGGWTHNGAAIVQYPDNGLNNQKWVFLRTPGTEAQELSEEELVSSSGDGLTAFPNPVVDFAEIRYSLSSDAEVSLFVSDINGRVIKKLVDKRRQDKGTYNLNLDATDLVPGIYFYTLAAGNTKVVKKLVRTK